MCGARRHVRITPESDRNSGHCRSLKGRALLLCPLVSDVDLLRYGEGIVHIDAEIPDQTEEILSYEISDEALESAAGTKRAAHYTLYYCTALDLCPVPSH